MVIDLLPVLLPGLSITVLICSSVVFNKTPANKSTLQWSPVIQTTIWAIKNSLYNGGGLYSETQNPCKQKYSTVKSFYSEHHMGRHKTLANKSIVQWSPFIQNTIWAIKNGLYNGGGLYSETQNPCKQKYSEVLLFRTPYGQSKTVFITEVVFIARHKTPANKSIVQWSPVIQTTIWAIKNSLYNEGGL